MQSGLTQPRSQPRAQRVTKERSAQRQAQQQAKDLRKSQREARDKARKEAREAAQRAAEREDEGADDMDNTDDPGEDRLPEDVLAALARRGRRYGGGDDGHADNAGHDGHDDDEDQRAIQRRVVSRQLRALAKPSNKRKKFGDGRMVASGVVVKSLKSALGKERARGVSASRRFLETRLERHDRDRRSLFVPSGARR
jgi:hypothetical protein